MKRQEGQFELEERQKLGRVAAKRIWKRWMMPPSLPSDRPSHRFRTSVREPGASEGLVTETSNQAVLRRIGRYILAVAAALLPCCALVCCVNTYLRVQNAIKTGAASIPFDTNTYYLLLLTTLWIFLAIEVVGRCNFQNFLVQWVGGIIPGWFVVCMILANALPQHITTSLENAGYIACKNPESISRGAARGKSHIFQRNLPSHTALSPPTFSLAPFSR